MTTVAGYGANSVLKKTRTTVREPWPSVIRHVKWTTMLNTIDALSGARVAPTKKDKLASQVGLIPTVDD